MISIPYKKSFEFEIGAKCCIQLAFEVNDKKYVQQIISSLSKKVIGLHMRLNEKSDRIYYVNEKPPIIKIPNFKNIEKATMNFGIHHKVDPYARFGSIGYNDNMVILNVSHGVADGGYFKYIAENIFDDTDINIPSHFPYEAKEIFKEKYEQSPNDIAFWDDDPDINRIITNDPSKLYQTFEVGYSTIKLPSSKFQCFDSKTKRLHSFTDSLWSSLFVASVIHMKKNPQFVFPKQMCIPTCTDFRRYLSKPNYSICSLYSTVIPKVPVSPKSSLSEIGKAMKIDLNRRLKRLEDFGFLKTIENLPDDENQNVTAPNSTKKVGIELTYVGAVNIKNPIKNIFMNLNMDSAGTETILSLMGFSCVEQPCKANPNGKNEVTLRLRYSPTTLYKEEVAQMMKSIEYILTKVPQETSIEETIKAVSSIHSKK